MIKTEPGGEKILKRKTILIAVCFSVLVGLLATETYASGFLQARNNGNNATIVTKPGTTADGTISVQGTGEVLIQPDRGIVTIGVITQASTASVAVQDNANTMSAVISGLNGIGISNDNIQTVYYYIYPQYSWSASPPTITGYQVTNEIQVTVIASGQTVAQLGAEVGQAIDVAAAKGANQIYGVQFTASDSAVQQAKQTALENATKDASTRAHIIADALGVTITGVISVSDTPSYYPLPIFYGGVSIASVNSTPIVPPQTLTFSDTVQAVFSIS